MRAKAGMRPTSRFATTASQPCLNSVAIRRTTRYERLQTASKKTTSCLSSSLWARQPTYRKTPSISPSSRESAKVSTRIKHRSPCTRTISLLGKTESSIHRGWQALPKPTVSASPTSEWRPGRADQTISRYSRALAGAKKLKT